MHIHRIRSGKEKQHLKVLLRRSRREGRRVVKDTVMNLTWWSAARLTLLESALQAKRAARKTALESEANLMIAKILTAEDNSDPSFQWQVLCALTV